MKKKYSQVIEIEECKQAVMLARVSSRKQERGASLNAQVERILYLSSLKKKFFLKFKYLQLYMSY